VKNLPNANIVAIFPEISRFLVAGSVLAVGKQMLLLGLEDTNVPNQVKNPLNDNPPRIRFIVKFTKDLPHRVSKIPYHLTWDIKRHI
jgi:hypothetical protein